MNSEQNTILITGVAGMIGSHLSEELLKKGEKVIGIDDLSFGKLENLKESFIYETFNFHRFSILDFEKLNEVIENVTIIVHLAANKKISENDSAIPTILNNGQGIENVLKIAKNKKIKVIYASTSDIYGLNQNIPLNEDDDLLIGKSYVRRWNYAVSKLYGEQLAFAYYHDFKVPIVVLRYFGGFSQRSNFSWSGGHVPIFIQSILTNQEIIIHGDGSQTRSMGFVSDLVEGTILAMYSEQAIGEIFNIGNDEELSVLETAELIHEISDSKEPLKIKFVPIKEVFGDYTEIQRRKPDLSKANKILGYAPKIKLREAIKLTIEELM